MDIHWLYNGSDDTAVCGFPVLAEEAPHGTAFSTRHDQATCTACRAVSPL